MGSADDARHAPAPVLRALADGRSLTRELAAELLTHLPELGSPGEQRLLDAWVEQAADTLLALSAALEERLLDLGSANCGGANSGNPDGAAGLRTDARRTMPR